MVHYMISISCQQKKHKVSVQQLMDVLGWLKQSINGFKLLQNHFEYGKLYHQLHLHMIVQLPNNFYFKPYTQYGTKHTHNNTFHVDYRKIYDYQGCIEYISKDIERTNILLDQYQIIQYYKTHYFNQTTNKYQRIA